MCSFSASTVSIFGAVCFSPRNPYQVHLPGANKITLQGGGKPQTAVSAHVECELAAVGVTQLPESFTLSTNRRLLPGAATRYAFWVLSLSLLTIVLRKAMKKDKMPA